MLNSYIASLKGHYNRSQLEEKGKTKGSKKVKTRSSDLEGWDWVLRSAEHVLAMLREAECQHEGGDLDSADTTTDLGLPALQERYKFFFESSAHLNDLIKLFLSTGAVPSQYRFKSDLIMKDWDDIEVRKG